MGAPPVIDQLVVNGVKAYARMGGPMLGLQTVEVGEFEPDTTTWLDDEWGDTGIELPDEDSGVEWILIHVNNGEWHLNRRSDYSSVMVGVAGEAVASNQVWDQFLEVYSVAGQTPAFRLTYLGISASGTLLMANTNRNQRLDKIEVRAIMETVEV